MIRQEKTTLPHSVATPHRATDLVPPLPGIAFVADRFNRCCSELFVFEIFWMPAATPVAVRWRAARRIFFQKRYARPARFHPVKCFPRY